MRYRGTAAARKISSTASERFAPGNHRAKQKLAIKKRTGWKDLKMKIVKCVFGIIGKLCLAFIGLVAWIGKRTF